MATVTVDPNTDHQIILGWQGALETGLHDFLSSGPNWHDAALDAAVDLGINQVLGGITSGLTENTTDYWANYVADGNDYSTNTAYAALNTNRRIPINDNADPNSANASGFKWSFLDWQIDEYIIPLQTKLAARGETLRWGLSYVHFSPDNQLHFNGAEYGELILQVWNHLNTNYSMIPDFLEICLEPDNSTNNLTESTFAAMVVAARDRLVAAGYSKPYFVGPSTVSGPNAEPYYENVKSANATAAGYIDEIGYHLYTGLSTAERQSLQTLAAADSKNTGMTEWAQATFHELHDDLRYTKVSSWEQFAMAYPTTDNGYQHFLVGAGPSYTITEAERTKYLRHYFYAIRGGAVRKGASISGTGSAGGSPLAFRNTNGTYVVVMKTTIAVDFDIAGLPDGTYKVRYTTGNGSSAPSAYWQSLADQVVSGGNTGTISMPDAGVITIYDENYLVPSEGSYKAVLSSSICNNVIF